MTFLNNLGNWAGNQIKNFGNDIGLPTMLHDIASVATNDKSWVGDAFQIAGDTFKASVAGASYVPRKVLGAGFNDVLLPTARFTYDVGGKYARQPISALATGLATGNFQEAWNQRSNISAGQAIAYLQSSLDPTATELHGNFNIFDPKDRQIFDTNWRYKTLSGAYDTVFTTVTDPLGKAFKAVGLAKAALITRPLGAEDATIGSLGRDFLFKPNAVRKATIISPQTLANKINEGRNADGSLYNTMEWFAKNDATKIINHPAVQASNDATTMSWLLGEVDNVDDVADTLLALSNKDTKAMARLVEKRRDLAFVYDKLKPVSKMDEDILNNLPTNGLTEDVNLLDAAAEHVAQLAKDPYFDYLTTLTKKGADLSKRTFGTSAFEKLAVQQAERKYARAMGIKADEMTAYPTFGIFQPTKYHPVVAVINFAEKWAAERPAGYFNANDSDSFKEMQAFGGMLRRIVGNEKAAPIIERHYDDFLRAGDVPENRTRVAQSFEDLATTAIHESLGISKETADYIWNSYKGRRATAMASIKDRKFLMTNDDTILKIPYLERQGANSLPMVDLENYTRVLKENSGLIKAIDGSHGIIDPDRDRYIAGILNDAWKASVLLRLGYTIRNVGEASLSILAKGYGLVAATDLSKEGFKNWWEHRQIGMDRMTDRTLVAKGLREDSIKLRSAMSQVQLERAQIAKLNQEIDDHMAAVELAFKRGQLTEEQTMEFLNLSSYRTGEYLYHGSPTGLRGLNPERPLAMTYSDDIANRYAEKGMPTISASEIYKRNTGRAYAMPKNLRNREGELIKEGGVRKPSLAMQTIAADMRDGFRNSVAKGNQVELYNPQSGTWRAIDPDSVSQKMLVEGTFRVRKPGNQGHVISSKVFGESVDLRTNNGTRVKLGLNDYPELKALGLDARRPDSWKGKEKEIFDWMRANGVGKVTLPDVKANGRATVLVDPTMVETATNKPAQILAKRQLDAIRKTRAVTSNQSKVMQMIQSTIENGGGTFKFMTGDVPQGGVAVAVRGGTFQYSLDAAKANPEAMAQHLAEHIENTIGKFSEADHFGTWVAPAEDGTMHIWAEPVNVVKNKAEAVKLGKERNQKGIADLDAYARGEDGFISTGGTGDVGASENFALGQSTKAVRSNVTRGTTGVRPELGEANRAASLSELATHIGSGKYPTDGITSLIRDLADRDAAARARHEHLLTRLDARVAEETRLTTSKKLVGTGMRRAKLYDGTVIEYPDAFQGELGQILAQRTDNADTYKLLADAPSQLFAARYGNMNEVRLSTKDPRYFTGYANFLNNFFRSPTENKIDPIIEQFLNGKTPESVIKWLRSPEGKTYASKMNIDDQAFKVASENLNVGTSAEDFVGNLHSAYQRYLPNSEIQEAFRNKQVDEIWLREHFKDTPAMPDIIGSVVPVGPKISGWQDGTQAVVNKLFYFLGSLPETTLARHPLARAVYRSEMQQRANVALSLKRSQLGDVNAELTLDEINGLRKDAIESTRKEVNKTLFTIMRKSYAGEKMRYIMPFFNAWENTIRRWATLSSDNPVAVAKAGQITASLSNQNNVVDANGNRTNKFSYDNVLVLPMPESFMQTMEKVPFGGGLAAAIRSAGSQISIPIKSMDIMFQGEATAGFGPLVAIPAGELEKMRPDMESILKPIIPFGPQEGNVIAATAKSLLPPALQKAAETWSGTRDGQWSRTFNTVYRYELIKFKLGERNTEPTFEEIQNLTNNMYRVKMLSNLVLPFAAQYDSPLSWYTQQYRKLQQTYKGDADSLFLQMYPEMAEATISASLNNTGVNASQQAVANLQKYKSLISQIGTTTPEMIGFIVNDPSGKYDFSQAAYQWQMANSPVLGSTMNFRGQRDPALLKQDANKKMGWIDYRKAMDYLDSQLKAQGYESYTENGAEDLLLAKQMFTTQLATSNKDWAADFYSMDKGKWIYRMQTIQKILTNPQWLKDNANRPVVTQLAIYYSTRTQVARELASRKADGGSGSLEANDNSDLKDLWDRTVGTLRSESGGEFDGFWQRFLQNDPVTLG
jgi:hypothetical protein